MNVHSLTEFGRSLKGKLIGAFLLIALLPLAISTYINFTQAQGALEESASNTLVAVRDVKAHEIEAYFNAIAGQVKTLSSDEAIITAMQEFTAAFEMMPDELAFTNAELSGAKSDVESYYRNEYLPRLNANLDSPASVSTYLPSMDVVTLAQYQYITSNPNPVGSKETLDYADDGTTYSEVHATYHPMVRQFLNQFGFYDIFLIEPDNGHIVYSVFKEADYGTSLFNGAYSDTNFAEVVKSAASATDKDFHRLIDYRSYDPSYAAPASFVASPIYDDSELVGVLAFQMPIDSINDVMQQRSGLGESGETYLVGGDTLMRSDSRFSEESTILNRSVDTDPVRAALAGDTGIMTAGDYRDVSVLSAYRPVNIEGVDWTLLAEIDSAEINAPMNDILRTAVGVVLAVTVVVVVVALLFSARLVGPVRKIADAMSGLSTQTLPALSAVTQSVANGDLTRLANVESRQVEVKSRDEIGQMADSYNVVVAEVGATGDAINDMVESLRTSMTEAANTADEVAEASNQLSSAADQASQATQNIASTSQSLATGAESQSHAVTETSVSVSQLSNAISSITQGSADQLTAVDAAGKIVDQVSSAMDGVAVSAQTAAEGARDAAQAAESGAGVVRDTVTGLEEIKRAVGDVAEKISVLGDRSTEIGNIVGVIDDIADQTNLLALNAAIEAARAGEQGRGFAVVADEVRQLAERVTAATQEISGLIEGVQAGVNESVAATDESASKVEEGVARANEAGEKIGAIMESVTTVASQVDQISAASEEVTASAQSMVETVQQVQEVAERNAQTGEAMTGDSDKVAAGMSGVDAVTTDNAAAAQEVSASAEEMSAQVEQVTASSQSLASMAGNLKTIVGKFKLAQG